MFHRPTWGQCPSVSGRAAVNSRALEALKMKDRQRGQGLGVQWRSTLNLIIPANRFFSQIRGCEPTWG